MKQNNDICVILNVLTYFKDVFDGASPLGGRSRFLQLEKYSIHTPQFTITQTQ